ncbi:MAG TPA: copper homeostasis protein CutC [Bacteroidales bacterium]|jgi:copper homeostasis protein|nr:copper homeostasis protein CutC [Bacteroidales bacterium]HNY51819.1 copper homeostasis protein CutC [Bacteroidales bacterium]HOG55958.1 copper homeostasis protein CutC [Bacteroidales bacterium]
MEFKLEICVDSAISALNAQSAGADRIELCDNLGEGGTTPGYGMIISARNNLSIGIHVLIRPRGGDFLYSDTEYDIMRRDIELCGENGIDGIVTGILLPDGTIDVERTARLIEFAYPMTATFHRAFDMCADPVRGLEDVIATGASRLLTSGQQNKALDAVELIRQLVIQAGERLIVMPGGGIDETNAAQIITATKAKELHLTGRMEIDSEMIFRRQGISMGSLPGNPEFKRKIADPEKIKKIIESLKMI